MEICNQRSGDGRALLVIGIHLSTFLNVIAFTRSNSPGQPSPVDLWHGGIILTDLNPDSRLKPAGGNKDALRRLLTGERGRLEVRGDDGRKT